MGRKPLRKKRKNDEEVTQEWISRILPVFQQKGFRHLTMDQVVKIAGVSKATFYKYYNSREKLMDEVIATKLAQLAKFQDELFDSSIDYYDRYFNAVKVSAAAMAQVSNKFLEDLRTSYPEKWTAVEDFRVFAVKRLEEFYVEGIEKGVLNNINPKVILMADTLFFKYMTDPKFLLAHNLTLHEAFTGYFTMKIEGILKQNRRTMDKYRKRLSVISANIQELN
jgi:AcrR family transcriptional regulator